MSGLELLSSYTSQNSVQADHGCWGLQYPDPLMFTHSRWLITHTGTLSQYKRALKTNTHCILQISSVFHTCRYRLRILFVFLLFWFNSCFSWNSTEPSFHLFLSFFLDYISVLFARVPLHPHLIPDKMYLFICFQSVKDPNSSVLWRAFSSQKM